MSNLLILFVITPLIAGMISVVTQLKKLILLIASIIFFYSLYITYISIKSDRFIKLEIGGWGKRLSIVLFMDSIILLLLIIFGLIFLVVI